MATITKRGRRWRAEVERRGVRKSASFATKLEASEWAAQTESDILKGARGAVPNKTFGDLLNRYSIEVSARKRGARWEQIRIEKLKRDPIAQVQLADLNATHFAQWRDRQLKTLTPASVRREWNVLNPALNIAVKEWRWLPANPMADVKRPAPAQSRDRRITQREIDALIHALGYDPQRKPESVTARVGAAFLFSIETAMRCGEVCGLRWSDVDLKACTARLAMTKNGTARMVPLSSAAVRILKNLPRGETVFALDTRQVDALFRKAKARAQIDDLHWHDTRHEAITRLAQKLEVLDLARMVGVRDLRILMIYYNATASEIAKRLG